jgi:hypothetical protein
MSRTAIAAGIALLTIVAPASAADDSQTLYYVQRGAPACQRVKDLDKMPALWRATPAAHAGDFAKLKCVWLAPNTRVAWSGTRIELFFARIATADHRTLVVYRNDLGRSPWQDPLRRDYVTREGAIACTSPFRIDEASQAIIAADKTWFGRTGCIRVSAGVAAHRIAPPIAEPGVWQVRLRTAKFGATAWMRSTELEVPPGGTD